MKKVLLAWEMGSGLGHVGPLRAVGAELVARGWPVGMASCNVEICRQAFAESGVVALPAPALPFSNELLKYPCTYSDILHDCGYASGTKLVEAVGQWLNIFDSFRPDLVLADHSPTALLASRAREFATATIGYGFTCPPDLGWPGLPSLRKEIPLPHWADEVESTVLDNMNFALKSCRAAPLTRVSELFGDVERQFLLTFEELDHYGRWRGHQKNANFRYYTPVGAIPGRHVQWQTGNATATGLTPQRVFVYLQDSPALLPLLRWLARRQISTVCVAPHMAPKDLEEFARSSVVVSTTPVDLRPLLGTCRLAVLNGGHGTVCACLMAGVPLVLMPRLLEHEITAYRLVDLGAARIAAPDDVESAGAALEAVVNDERYHAAARALAARYAGASERENIASLVDDILRLQG